MEILEMIKEQGDKLTNEELKFLVDELNTGAYDPEYKKQCFDLIYQIKERKKIYKVKKETKPDEVLIVTPIGSQENLSAEQRFFKELENGRMICEGPHVVTRYVDNKLLDNSFFFQNMSKLKDDEARAFFSSIRLDENQIEEVFKTAPKGLIELTQCISEDFFIKHFDELDIKALKKNVVTDWILNPKIRSNKIIIFLKMKGVRL